MPTLLFPGRHILNTRFQEQYLRANLGRPVEELSLLRPPSAGSVLSGTLDRVVFAITSANQSHSRYNPVPLEVRAIGVDRFARGLKDALSVAYRIVPVPHYQPSPRFAGIVLKEITEATEALVVLTPADTVVLSSTPEVFRQYLALGFSVLPVELESLESNAYCAATPADVLKFVVEAGEAWAGDPRVRQELSDATLGLWQDFPDVPRRVARFFRDPLLTEQGDLTATRNYNVYAAGMNNPAALQLKYDDIKSAIVPGKIVDEGCADGALLVPVARDFPDSDLIGIEITGEFLARCAERQRAGQFGGTYVHFHQRNITEPVFEPDSIDTTICNSTTHELWSYGQQAKTVRAYLREKFRQTRRGGRIIIRDVVGPAGKDDEVFLHCNDADGSNEDDVAKPFDSPAALARHLTGLSTAARFRRFARQFLADLRAKDRRGPETRPRFREETVAGVGYFVVRLADAVEFMMKKDYCDNWDCEMNEQFAFWDFDEWKRELTEAGFTVAEGSRAYVNPWIIRNRFEGKVELFRRTPAGLEKMPYPVTNMVLIGEKRGEPAPHSPSAGARDLR